MQIVSGHHNEIWSKEIDSDERFLVSGSSSIEI